MAVVQVACYVLCAMIAHLALACQVGVVDVVQWLVLVVAQWCEALQHHETDKQLSSRLLVAGEGL